MSYDHINYLGHRIELHYDTDAENPREFQSDMSTFVGFPHRNYRIGDERIDPSEYHVVCAACEGQGGPADPNIVCGQCGGDGWVYPTSLDDFAEAWAKDNDVRIWRYVGMLDHSGVTYYLGGGAHWSDSAGWDSGTCGIIGYERSKLRAVGHDDPDALTDDQLVEWLKGEIDTYETWASGGCCGYIIHSPNGGNELDSCWGYYSDDEAYEQAKAIVDYEVSHYGIEFVESYLRLAATA